MSQSPTTVSYSLESILSEIKDGIKEVNQKIDRLDRKFEEKFNSLQRDGSDFKIAQMEIRGEIRTLDERLSGEIRTLDERLAG